MTTVSPRTLEKVLAVLAVDIGLTPRDVHMKVDMLSRITIRHALRCLCESGAVRYTGEDSARLYFKVTP